MQTAGRQHRLELSQKRGLATPRRAAQHQEFPLLHGQRQIVQHFLCPLRVIKGKMFNFYVWSLPDRQGARLP